MKRMVAASCAFAVACCSLCIADPVTVCTNLVGTYADPKEPDKPAMVVTFTNGHFWTANIPPKKTIVSVTPTEEGLLVIEGPLDRNVYRLSCTEKPGVFVVESLGHEGHLLPKELVTRREVVRVHPPKEATIEK